MNFKYYQLEDKIVKFVGDSQQHIEIDESDQDNVILAKLTGEVGEEIDLIREERRRFYREMNAAFRRMLKNIL